MSPFHVSYLVAWMLAALAAISVREALADTAWLYALVNSRVEPARRREGPPTGSRLPHLRAKLLDSEGTVDLGTLDDRGTILMFISAIDSGEPLPQSKLAASMHGLWHKSERHLYVICHGDADQCRPAIPRLSCGSEYPHEIPVLLDPSGEIGRAFAIRRTPSAVYADEARVSRYGMLKD